MLAQCADAVFDVSEKKSYVCLREGGGGESKEIHPESNSIHRWSLSKHAHMG
ncbi:MAG: hypothetical protein OJF50_000631 [Nitrospira sp.]|nr:hypothetical protein [Nitrospira sp.]